MTTDPMHDRRLMALADCRASMQTLIDHVPPNLTITVIDGKTAQSETMVNYDLLRAVYAFSIDRLQYEISAHIAGGNA